MTSNKDTLTGIYINTFAVGNTNQFECTKTLNLDQLFRSNVFLYYLEYALDKGNGRLEVHIICLRKSQC